MMIFYCTHDLKTLTLCFKNVPSYFLKNRCYINQFQYDLARNILRKYAANVCNLAHLTLELYLHYLVKITQVLFQQFTTVW